MTRRHVLSIALAACAALGAAWYLHDPPWVGGVTSGILNWEEEEGVRFRWTRGHAVFYVPSDATTMTLQMRPWFPGPDGKPVSVSITVDDRPLTEIVLRDEKAWTSTTLPLPRQASSRRVRRIDRRVSRTVPPFHLGVEMGVVRTQ